MAPARMVSFMKTHAKSCEICLQDADLKEEIAKITEIVLPESKIPKAIRQKNEQAAQREAEKEDEQNDENDDADTELDEDDEEGGEDIENDEEDEDEEEEEGDFNDDPELLTPP